MKVTTKVATKSLTFASAALIAFVTLWESGGRTINTVYAGKLAGDGSTAVNNTVFNSDTMTTGYKLSN